MQQKTVTIRFPEEIEYKLSIAAAYDRINRSELIRKLVTEYVVNHPMLKNGEVPQSKLETPENSPQ